MLENFDTSGEFEELKGYDLEFYEKILLCVMKRIDQVESEHKDLVKVEQFLTNKVRKLQEEQGVE